PGLRAAHRRRLRLALAAVSLLVRAALAVIALAALPLAAQPVMDDSRLTAEPVLADFSLDLPTSMAFLGPDDILVLEKNTGDVRRLLGGVLQPNPVLHVDVENDSERGLLGIAINREDPPGVFLYYTQASPLANRVYRYDWNAGSGQLENPQLVLDLPATPGPNHDGGVLVLGPPALGANEGLLGEGAPLFTVIGDLNRNGKLQNHPEGSSPDDTGAVFRVDQAGDPFPGNPFTPYCEGNEAQTCATDLECGADGPCITEVGSYWAYGVRNSFGLALDPVTGGIWDTENGPGSFDEVNRLPPGTNSGWEQIMGPDRLDPQDPDDLWDMPGEGSTYSDPEFSWFDTNAPTGILFPVGSSWGPDYDNVVLVSDNNRGQIYALPLDGPRTALDLAAFPSLTDLVADSDAEADLLRVGSGFVAATDLELGPDGHVYAVAIGLGNIYRIIGKIFEDDFETGDTSAWDVVAQ
ncbi:MAG: PQQ-dependent sugar dehydrogenase, partial [Thermoanaerobaculia bacterium]